jgi:aminobenzoyl-glutamate transport protein
MPKMESVTTRDQLGMVCGLLSMGLCIALLAWWAWPADSALRNADGSLTAYRPPAPLMLAIVPLIFFIFLVPGVVHGYVSGNFESHRDIIKGMSRSMETMGYYLVLVFFAALFIAAFDESNIGVLLAVKGATFLKESGAPPAVTIVGIILLAAFVNLVIGSASAKWAMLAPVFVPMLMLVGISPELTQAAYRVGDSCTNIITPMMPYFPLVVVFCQRYVKGTGIGTVGAMMLPYSFVFIIAWTLFLLAYWGLGIDLGLQAPYTYTPPVQ